MSVSGEQRKLAAIIAADVVGYSRLMGRDESGTLARLREHRRQRFEPALARHGGRLVKLTGDGALAEFPSAVGALSAAIEFQQAMAEANCDLPPDTAIVFRLGLHLGDLIVEGDDLYGDGVNVAARLESEAPAGGIVISRTVHEAVDGRLKATFHDLGDLALKNIERPTRAFRVVWDAADWTTSAPAEGTSPPAAAVAAADAPLALPDKPSIAVLPFQNMSGDPEQEYFADGMVEDIITALSRIRWLFVIARNSSFTYKGRAVDVKQVGRELGVRYVLEGSIRKAVNRVRIAGQLIEAASGAHLWADRFEGSQDDVFELQDQVTASIVGVLTPKLELAEIERAKRKPTGNLDAYDCYLRAVASTRLRTRASVDEALSLCLWAIELDPNFAAACGQATWCYVMRKTQGWVTDRQQEIAETDRLARRAWALDRDDAVAIGTAGYTLAFVVGDLDAGAAYIERALALNSNYAPNWTWSGLINVWLGRGDVAIDHESRAMRLSPLDPLTYLMRNAIAHAHYFTGRYDEASAWAGKSLHEMPDYHPALRIVVAAAAMSNRHDEATRLRERLQQLDPTLRVSTLRDRLGPYRDPEHPARFAEGLRRAGLPK